MSLGVFWFLDLEVTSFLGLLPSSSHFPWIALLRVDPFCGGSPRGPLLTMVALSAGMQHLKACCVLELQSHSAQAQEFTEPAVNPAPLVSELTVVLHRGWDSALETRAEASSPSRASLLLSCSSLSSFIFPYFLTEKIKSANTVLTDPYRGLHVVSRPPIHSLNASVHSAKVSCSPCMMHGWDRSVIKAGGGLV